MGNEKEHFGRPAKVRNYGSHFGWMEERNWENWENWGKQG